MVTEKATISNLCIKKLLPIKTNLLLIEEEGKNHYALIKGFNTFIYDHIMHHGRKYFFRYCIQDSIAEEILKLHVRDSFKTNDKQRINMPKNGEYIKLKHFESMFCRL